MARFCQTCHDAQDNDPPSKQGVRIRASVFFDGTLNSRTNTSLGKPDSKSWLGSYDSYKDDYSNVSKLEEVLLLPHKGYDLSNHFYIEGIGTKDGESDSFKGYALGIGDTGIDAKAKKGIDDIYKFITERMSKDVPITCIHLDSFGFSRGAAAARYFIHQAIYNSDTALKERLAHDGFTVGEVKTRFVGLFDTVSYYGGIDNLHLNAVQHAEKVVQLAAAEEHRTNFSLKNIKSAVNAGVGLQIFLPGVHSDIGGGYDSELDKKEENWELLLIENPVLVDPIMPAFRPFFANSTVKREYRWMITQGWYQKQELKKSFTSLIGNRSPIPNTYALIPLQMMAKYAKEWALDFDISRYSVPPTLAGIDKILKDYAASHGNASQPSDWINNVTDEIRKLRGIYLHFSARYNGTILKGALIEANAPNWSTGDPETGQRQRIIQDG